MTLYAYSRPFYLSQMAQLRLMIRENRQAHAARRLLKQAQAEAASLRASTARAKLRGGWL